MKSKILIWTCRYRDNLDALSFIDKLKVPDNKKVVWIISYNNPHPPQEIVTINTEKFSVSYSKGWENIISGLNLAREFALLNGYDYMFTMEDDVIVPEDAIIRLLSWKKDIVCSAYKLKNSKYSPGLFKGLIKVNFVTFGCTLISRKVLEKVEFKVINKNGKIGDMAFSEDARRAGFELYADTDLICPHIGT